MHGSRYDLPIQHGPDGSQSGVGTQAREIRFQFARIQLLARVWSLPWRSGSRPNATQLFNKSVMRTQFVLDRISPEPMSGCWLWSGEITRAGYGAVSKTVNTKRQMAHRVVYELYKGAIPDGLELDHKCLMKLCVNPDHLEPVTHAENMRRYRETIRPRTHCRYGHVMCCDNLTVSGGKRFCRTCNRKHQTRRRREAKR